MMLVRLGEAGQGQVWLQILKGTQGYYPAIGDLGGDFGIPIGDDLDSSCSVEEW
jgi:hypothetical protein